MIPKKKYDKNDSKLKIFPPIGLKITKSPSRKSHLLRAFQDLASTSLKVLLSFHLIEFSMTKLFNTQKLLYHIKTPWCTVTHQGYSKGTKSTARDTMHGLTNKTNKTKQTNKSSLIARYGTTREFQSGTKTDLRNSFEASAVMG